MRNKVMLIDDHPAMLMALKSMLLNQVPFEVVAQAQSGRNSQRKQGNDPKHHAHVSVPPAKC